MKVTSYAAWSAMLAALCLGRAYMATTNSAQLLAYVLASKAHVLVSLFTTATHPLQ